MHRTENPDQYEGIDRYFGAIDSASSPVVYSARSISPNESDEFPQKGIGLITNIRRRKI
jgi:hypothetical protein